MIEKGFTGVMSCLQNLNEEPENWYPGGYPLVTMMTVELRKGHNKPVIRKALTNLKGQLFQLYQKEREEWGI